MDLFGSGRSASFAIKASTQICVLTCDGNEVLGAQIWRVRITVTPRGPVQHRLAARLASPLGRAVGGAEAPNGSSPIRAAIPDAGKEMASHVRDGQALDRLSSPTSPPPEDDSCISSATKCAAAVA